MKALFSASRDQGGVLDALDRSLAIIEFTKDGQIHRANANICAALG